MICLACGYSASRDYVAMADTCPSCKASPFEEVGNFGVTTDYEYAVTHKRQRLTVWSGPFYATFEAHALSLPLGRGYMLTTYNGDKVRVKTHLRGEDNWREVDAAIARALTIHYKAVGAKTLAETGVSR